MTDNNNDWIADKIMAQEDKLMEALAEKRFKEIEGTSESRTPDAPSQEPVPVDSAAEKQAFADLLALFAKSDSEENGTAIQALDLDQFAEDEFTPTEADNANPEA